jgi:hypothetical protein
MKVSLAVEDMRKRNSEGNSMIQQTTLLLRFIWQLPSWREELLATFEQWAVNGASRNDVKGRLKEVIGKHLTYDSIEHTRVIDLDQLNWDQLTEFLCTCFYRRRLRSSLPDVPSDNLWMELSNKAAWGPLSLHPQQDRAIKETVPVPLFPLEQKLLTYGGTRMIYRFEPDLKKLFRSGAVFDEPAELIAGEEHSCHANVACIWNQNKEELAIGTGYALSGDGLWRQHSWLVRKEPIAGQYRLLETTIKRLKYFGILLTKSEAQAFYEMNM